MQESDTRWVWYGGRPSLDFVNTRQDRAGAETLDRPGDLAEWFRAAGLLTDRVTIDDSLLADAIELRAAVDAVVQAVVTKTAIPPAALRALNDRLATTVEQPPQLRTVDDVPLLYPDASRQPDVRHALDRITLDAAQLLGTDLRSRLRICPGPGCGGRFLDDSPAGRRRWCSMAICGNRHKASSHRRRQQDNG